jgi:PKD repeat protein
MKLKSILCSDRVCNLHISFTNRNILRKHAILLVLFFASASVFAQEGKPLKSAEDFLEHRGEVYFSFALPGPEVFKLLFNEISVDHLHDGKVYAYANAQEFAFFRELELDYQVLTPPGMVDFDLNMKDWDALQAKNLTETWDFYPTYEAYVALMYQFQADFPELCQIHNIGQTVMGRDLLFAKITADVNQRKAEPQFMYTSTMHGDETAGFVLSLRLIHYLLTHYGVDDAITELLDNMEIWICPNENPDGTYTNNNNTVIGATRGNANGIDLNRNYPNWVNPPSSAQQPETTAMIAFTDTMHFVMSANMHGGIECVNYPFDSYTSTNPANRHADHFWWQLVSHEYADTARFYSPSGYMNPSGSSFNNGVTHGGDWYVVYGSRQDYMNYYAATRELTLELSNQKLLNPALLPAHWEYNHRSFLNYIRQAGYGLRGAVTDAETGQPLVAKIETISHDQHNSQVFSDPIHGIYFRPLLEGTYDVRVTAEGYPPAEFFGVEISNYEVTTLDVQLGGALYADFSAQPRILPEGGYVDFTDNSYGDVQQWAWSFPGGEPDIYSLQHPLNVIYPEAGSYVVSLEVSGPEGGHTTTRPGYIEVLSVAAPGDFLMANQTVATCGGYFYDSGGPSGQYSNNENYVFTFYPATQGDMLQFVFEEFQVEAHGSCNWDWLRIFNGPDTDAPLIGQYCGTNSPGMVTADNPSGAITFQFRSDGSITEQGWKAAISCIPATRRLYVSLEGSGGYSLSGNPISGDNPYLFAYEAEAALEALEDGASVFEHWLVNGELDTNPLLNLTMDENFHVKGVFSAVEGPVAVFEPDTLEFPVIVTPGESHAILVIHNHGTENLLARLTEFTGDAVFGTTVPTKDLYSIAPGDSGQIEFWFASAEAGSFSGQAHFTTNDPMNPEVSIELLGTAEAGGAIIYVVEHDLDFGKVVAGESSQKTLSLRNSGNTDLVIDALLFTDDAFATETTLPVTLAGDAFFDFILSFSPTEIREYEATLTFQTNALNDGEVEVLLRGEGDQGVFTGPQPETGLPVTFFPNPVQTESLLRISMDRPGHLEVMLYDVSGALAIPLFSGQKEAGIHEMNAGHAFSSLIPGVYLVRVTWPGGTTTLRVILNP